MDQRNSYETRFNDSYSSAQELRSSGEYEKALKKFSTAIKLAQNLDKQKDERIYNSYLGAARCHYRLGNTTEAEKKYRLALSSIEFLEEYDQAIQASVLWEIAVLYTDQKRFQEAAQFFQNSILITYQTSGPNNRFIADCLWGLSKCLCALGNLDQAEEVIRNALKIYEDCQENVRQAVFTNRKNLASILIERNKYTEALKEAKKATDSYKLLSKEERKELSRLYFRLAWCAQRNSDHALADKSLGQALRLTRLANGTNSPVTAMTKLAVAHNKNCLGKYKEAETILNSAIKQLKKEDHETFKHDIAGALFELGQCYIKQKKTKAAIHALEELLTIHEDDPLFSPELFADTLHSLALCHEVDSNLKRAKELNQRSIFIKEQIYGVVHEEVAQSLFQLSSCLRKLDDYHESDFARFRASEITEALFTSS